MTDYGPIGPVGNAGKEIRYRATTGREFRVTTTNALDPARGGFFAQEVRESQRLSCGCELYHPEQPYWRCYYCVCWTMCERHRRQCGYCGRDICDHNHLRTLKWGQNVLTLCPTCKRVLLVRKAFHLTGSFFRWLLEPR